MTKSDQIRALAAQGLKPAEIAQQLGIRYQHAYNVLNARPARNSLSTTTGDIATGMALPPVSSTKPPLTVDTLLAGGFQRVSQWMLSGDDLGLELPVPKDVGVYAFAKAGIVHYVGVATIGLSKRLYFYGSGRLPAHQPETQCHHQGRTTRSEFYRHLRRVTT